TRCAGGSWGAHSGRVIGGSGGCGGRAPPVVATVARCLRPRFRCPPTTTTPRTRRACSTRIASARRWSSRPVMWPGSSSCRRGSRAASGAGQQLPVLRADGLDESLLHEPAALTGDDVPLARAADDPDPALGLDAVRDRPEREPAVHPGHGVRERADLVD